MSNQSVPSFNPVRIGTRRVVEALLDQLRVPYTRTFVRQFLDTHPESPSLLSISHVLQALGVANVAVQMAPGELEKVDFPAIASLNTRDRNFVMLSGLEAGKLRYYHDQQGWLEETVDEFQRKWSGVIIMVEADETAGEPNYEANRQGEKLDVFKTTCTAVCLALWCTATVWLGYTHYPGQISGWLPLLLLKLAGGAGCVLLLYVKGYAYKDRAYALNSLKGLSRNLDCTQLLSAPAVTRRGGLDMTQAGVVYFAGGLLSLSLALVCGQWPAAGGVLLLLNLLTLPYSLFLLYYQVRVLNQLCLLCLLVLGVLWLECWVSLRTVPLPPGEMDAAAVYLLLVGYLVPAGVWGALSGKVNHGMASFYQERKLKAFTCNPAIMEAVLQVSKPVAGKVDADPPPPVIVLGDPGAEAAIELYLDPYATRGGEAFAQVTATVKRYAQVKANVYIVGNNALSNQFADHIIACLLAYGSPKTAEVLGDWYTTRGRNYLQWQKKYPVPGQVDPAQVDLVQQQWRRKTNPMPAGSLPVISINGRVIPNGLQLEDFHVYLGNL